MKIIKQIKNGFAQIGKSMFRIGQGFYDMFNFSSNDLLKEMEEKTKDNYPYGGFEQDIKNFESDMENVYGDFNRAFAQTTKKSYLKK